MRIKRNFILFKYRIQKDLLRIILKKTIGKYTIINEFKHENIHVEISKIILAHKLKVLIELENL